jgi:Protein of unknown function (DUF3987)
MGYFDTAENRQRIAERVEELKPTIFGDKTAGDEIDSNGDIIPKSTAITYIPSPLKAHIQKIADISITPDDTVVVASLTALCALTNGCTVKENQDESGTTILIYGASFMPSESGKSTALNNARRYFLEWKQQALQAQNASIEKQRVAIEAELKSAKPADKKELMERLSSLGYVGDTYIDGATAEGLEQSLLAESSLSVCLDEFGKYYQQSQKNEQKASYLRVLQNAFDSGKYTTNRTKSGGYSKTIPIRGMGLYLASTIGNSNLSPKHFGELIEDGFLNRCLITFETEPKPMPPSKELNIFMANDIETFSRHFNRYAQNTCYWLDAQALAYYLSIKSELDKERMLNAKTLSKGMGVMRQSLIALRIACIYHIAKHCESDIRVSQIDKETLMQAVSLVRYIATTHHKHIAKYIGEATAPDPLERLVKAIRDGKDTVRDIQQSLRLPAPVIKAMVDTAINQHLVFIDSNGRLTA